MILYYAMGGGMGHLVRASAFLNAYHFNQYKILTASRFSSMVFNRKSIIQVDQNLENSPGAFFELLRNEINRNRCHTLILDSFSHGILGEIKSFESLNVEKIWYITRRMKWDVYKRKACCDISIDRSIIVEELEDEHYSFIQNNSKTIEEMSLKYPTSWVPGAFIANLTSEPTWIIVHAGNKEEILILYKKVLKLMKVSERKSRCILISPEDPCIEGLEHLSFYPAAALFRYTEMIITGCGFNIMQQTEVYRNKHLFVPFERKYDDQFWRAKEAKKNRS